MIHSYSPFIKFLHWVMALLMIALVTVGFLMAEILPEPLRFSFYGIHKSLGIVVFVLALIRLSVRLTTHHVPPPPVNTPKITRFFARLVYLGFYVVMIGFPLSGYIMSVTGGHDVAVFGYGLPSLFAQNHDISHVAREIHEALGYTFCVLLALHIGGVLFHAIFEKNNILRRMI